MLQKNTFSTKGNTYTYWTEGKKENTPVIILPGFTGSHGDVSEFAKYFEDTYFVVIPDLPGWGDSPKGKYHLTIHGYANFVHDLLKHLNLEKKAILIGHCMGSVVVIECGVLFPEKLQALFVVSVPYLDGEMSAKMFAHLAIMSTKVPRIFRPFFFFFRSRIIAVPLGFLVVQSRSWRKKVSIIVKNTIKQQFQDEEVTENNWNSLVLYNYEKIRTMSLPMHILHGEKDLLIPQKQIRKLADMCRHATFDSIPHAGHMPPVETPKTLFSLIAQYL